MASADVMGKELSREFFSLHGRITDVKERLAGFLERKSDQMSG